MLYFRRKLRPHNPLLGNRLPTTYCEDRSHGLEFGVASDYDWHLRVSGLRRGNPPAGPHVHIHSPLQVGGSHLSRIAERLFFNVLKPKSGDST